MKIDEQFKSLVPLAPISRQYLPDTSANTNYLDIVAAKEPKAIPTLMKKQLTVREAEARLNVSQTFSNDHKAEICMWLSNRQPGDSGLQLDSICTATECGILFSKCTKLKLRTRVQIL